MKELSEAIGISRPTLSRYFQDPKTVRPSTLKKIEERLSGVDYVYNFIATRQNRKSTKLIGVIIPHYKDLFFTSLLEAIERTARDLGYTIITQSSDGNGEMEAQAVTKLRSMSADGAIIAPLGNESINGAFENASEEFPIVFVDSHAETTVENADFVGTDNQQSIAAIVDYLCRTGEPPAFLRMPRLNSNAQEREDAYLTKMEALGHNPHFIEATNIPDSWQFEAYGYNVMDAHFSRQRYTSTTILCANDRISIGAIRAANKHGLFNKNTEGSKALRIAGHDDHPLSRYMYPALTTVAQDIEGIGKSSVELLVERIQGELEAPPMRLLKEAALMLREST